MLKTIFAHPFRAINVLDIKITTVICTYIHIAQELQSLPHREHNLSQLGRKNSRRGVGVKLTTCSLLPSYRIIGSLASFSLYIELFISHKDKSIFYILHGELFQYE
jgi:hypothetical protein